MEGLDDNGLEVFQVLFRIVGVHPRAQRPGLRGREEGPGVKVPTWTERSSCCRNVTGIGLKLLASTFRSELGKSAPKDG